MFSFKRTRARLGGGAHCAPTEKGITAQKFKATERSPSGPPRLVALLVEQEAGEGAAQRRATGATEVVRDEAGAKVRRETDVEQAEMRDGGVGGAGELGQNSGRCPPGVETRGGPAPSCGPRRCERDGPAVCRRRKRGSGRRMSCRSACPDGLRDRRRRSYTVRGWRPSDRTSGVPRQRSLEHSW